MNLKQSKGRTQFPPIHTALDDGLLLIGGDLSVPTLVDAYGRGIFPWPVVDGRREILAWFSPDPRAVLPLDQLHVSRRLRRRLRRGEFEFAVDRDFAAVVSACSEPRATDTGTWITPSLAAAYCDLFQQGYAHSVEAYADGQLAGGVYGVAIGGFFAGESMFHRRRDASKAALFHLVARLQQRGFALFDVQQASGHMTRLGATEIPRERYLRQLRDALRLPVCFR